MDLRKKADHAAAVITRAQRFDFAVTEQIGDLGELLGGFKRRWIVGFEIVAVGAVKDINVPERRVIALLDDLQGFVVTGGDQGAAGFALVKKFVLGDFLGLGMVRDEDDLDVLITCAR